MSFSLKLAQTEEMRIAIKITELNLNLTEVLHSHLEFMIRQSDKMGIDFPDSERTIELMKKEKQIVDSITSLSKHFQEKPSPEMKRFDFSPDNERESKNCKIARVFIQEVMENRGVPP